MPPDPAGAQLGAWTLPATEMNPTMNRRASALLLSALLVPAALAQVNGLPPGQLQPNQRSFMLSTGTSQVYDVIGDTGPDGKVARPDAMLDVLALQHNPLLDAAARERLRPIVRSWVAEVDKQLIDNIDFMERIEPADGSPGILSTLDANDGTMMRMINQMVLQLGAAGNLTTRLHNEGELKQDEFTLNQQIVAEYLQRCMREDNPQNNGPDKPEDAAERTNRYNRFLFAVAASDASASYHRQLTEAAPNMDKLVASLNLKPPDAAKLKDSVSAATSAKTDLDRRKASRAVLDRLTFDQRRAVLSKSRELAPPFDPFPGAASAQSSTAPAHAGG